ncbi:MULTISPECIES: SPOR domain-containing protein [unclassified Campylobacter]|uniref:SPOR domain-containing protein n=1 Tax=unclassified Campylobacter TaxID=2593542 RepID=UPI0022E9A2CE|nr:MULTISPECIES: SPOR domain-containing protein [unclassified Campylobacter]MDA3079121.1 SPOR domain-containing protein [Campylobacter sp. CS_NA2]MDA3080576.1 SPOR domain-containing protein [Campylobacter sp. CS_NA1]MDA3085219.1 SPOR domain-containing protein [Campylobacter sp. CS_ED1]MDA3089996.1 SPOR domain-containing protein [Campylobacter sp. CS_ED2]WBR51461.1 SPOR domain-containing protein [Campylobacter sp. CS_NA3]
MNHNPYSMEDINDIVLNRNGNDKSASVKKILTAIAILIILFLIVLIIMKFINKGNIDTSANLQMPSEAELAKKEQTPKLEPIVITPKPEPKKEEPKVEVKKPEQPKIEPSEPQNDAKFEIKKEEVKVDVKEQIIEIKKEEPKSVEQIVIKDEPKPQEVQKQPEPKKVEIQQPKPQEVQKQPEPKKVEIQQPKTEPVKTAQKIEPKKTEPKVQPKPEPKKEQPKVETKKPEPKKEEPKKQEQPKNNEPAKTQPKGGNIKDVANLASGTYIQVHALSQYNPNAPSIKKISEKGYTPIAHKSGNLTRILIGPFKNNDELSKAMSDVKTLNNEAFVYRVK